MTDRVFIHLRKMVEEPPVRFMDVMVVPNEEGGVQLVPKLPLSETWDYDRSIHMNEDQAYQLRNGMAKWLPDLPPGVGMLWQFGMYIAFIVGLVIGVWIG